MNFEWVTGFVVGLLAVAVVFAVVRRMALRRGEGPRKYDERQVAARGKAYAAAYFTLLIYLAVWLVLSSLELPFFPGTAAILLGFLLSITVFVCYSIFHDAYFRCSERPTTWLWVIGAVSALNLGIGIGRICRGATLAERLFENANLMVGAVTTLILACSLVKLAMDRRGGEE